MNFWAVFIALFLVFAWWAFNNSYSTGESTPDIYGATIPRKWWFQGTVLMNYNGYQFIRTDESNITINIKPQAGAQTTKYGKYTVSDDSLIMTINIVNGETWTLFYIDEQTLKLDFGDGTYTMLNLGQPCSQWNGTTCIKK